MATTKPKAREDLALVEIDGEAVIYDEQRGELHHLNATATLIFQLCDGHTTVAEFSADIAEAYKAAPTEVEGEVRKLIRQLRKAGLLEGTRGQANGRAS